jgi:hypothetical protein
MWIKTRQLIKQTIETRQLIENTDLLVFNLLQILFNLLTTKAKSGGGAVNRFFSASLTLTKSKLECLPPEHI